MKRPGTESALPADFVAGNYFDKYGSKNPIHKALVGGFLRCAESLLSIAAPMRVLEVGCGSGDLARHLFGRGGQPRPVEYTGIDISPLETAQARGRCPNWSFQTASAYALPFPDDSFDLVMACEVLEHLDRPADGLREIRRVCRSYALVSVPWEPVWRLLNLARGKYWLRFGNTPGHERHFTRRGIRAMVGGQFDVVAERRPFPWTMLLARTR